MFGWIKRAALWTAGRLLKATPKPERKSTMLKPLLAATLLSFVTGCVSVASGPAICDGTSAARTKHAAALAEDGGDKSVATGATLIMMLDAGCK